MVFPAVQNARQTVSPVTGAGATTFSVNPDSMMGEPYASKRYRRHKQDSYLQLSTDSGSHFLGVINGTEDASKRRTIYILSIVPLDQPTTGSGVSHRNHADMLSRAGYDVVVIEANNRRANETIQTPWKTLNLLFSGNGEKTITATLPFNFPVFTKHALSSQQFSQLTDAEMENYFLSWAWAIRSAVLMFGPPDGMIVGHAWLTSALTAVYPTMVHVHGPDMLVGYEEERVRAVVNFGMERSDAVVVTSQQQYENAMRQYGVKDEKIKLVKRAYDPKIFFPNRNIDRKTIIGRYSKEATSLEFDKPWVVFAGRAIHLKGVDLLVEAFRKVHERTGAHLIVIGGGDFSKIEGPDGQVINIHDKVEEYGLTDFVHFTGPLPQSEMADVVSLSDAYVLPSRYEAFGLAALEGLALGVTPILTRNGGFDALVGAERDISTMVEINGPGDTEGRFSDRTVSEQLADAVTVEILRPVDEKERRGMAAHHYAFSNFSKDVIEPSLISMVEQVIEERSKKGPLAEPGQEAFQEHGKKIATITPDNEVVESFRYLEDNPTPYAFQAFQQTVATFLGNTQFQNPLNVGALTLLGMVPEAIYDYVAKASDVTVERVKDVFLRPWGGRNNGVAR